MKANVSVPSSRFARYATASAAALGAAAAAEGQFIGDYSLEGPPANTFSNPTSPSTFGLWTYSNAQNPLGSSITLVTSTGSSLDLTAYTGFQSSTVVFDFTAVAAGSGNVSFDYSSSFSGVAGSFRYEVNGSNTFVTSATDSSSISFSVNSGDTFGFRLTAAYAPYTTMQVSITNFSAPAAIPEAGSASLLAGVASLGFVGLMAHRKLRERAAAQIAN
jgi:hypothetical protein